MLGRNTASTYRVCREPGTVWGEVLLEGGKGRTTPGPITIPVFILGTVGSHCREF